MMGDTSVARTSSMPASRAVPRFWSRRVSAEKFSLGMLGALVMVMSAFVLAGFPTTRTFTVFFANSSMAFPWPSKMAAFACNKSLRSMPLPLGLAPTSSAMSASVNAAS